MSDTPNVDQTPEMPQKGRHFRDGDEYFAPEPVPVSSNNSEVKQNRSVDSDLSFLDNFGLIGRSSEPGYAAATPKDVEVDAAYTRVHTKRTPRQERIAVVGDKAGFVAEGGLGTHHHNNPYAKRPKKKNWKLRALIGLVVVLVGVGAGYVVYTHRPVQVTLNGERRTMTINTTLAQVKADEGIADNPGNLVSVSGKTLEEGKGDPYSVTVNGEKKSFEDGANYKVQGGETISFDKGGDIMEPYESTTVETQPKLEMDGNWGAVAYISQWGKVDKREKRTGKTSGETADGTVYQEGQNCVITVKNVEPKDGQKLVALTFDDGPSQYTERYLKILKEHGAVATFFNLGEQINEMPDVTKAIVDAGSQVASHTWSHLQLTATPSDKVYDEVTKTFKTLQDKCGITTTMIRPPYGDFRQTTWLETKGTMSISCLWNMDSEDWRLPGASSIVANSINGIAPGYIILMHDGGGNREQDLEALPQIIDKLHEQGYTFVTVSDLLKSDESIPAEVASCEQTMPEDATWPTELA